MKKNNKSGTLSGAAVLACANIVCRILGFMFKIPLSNLIGSEGMGYFSLATQVFGVAAFPSTGGLPTVFGRHIASRNEKSEPTLPLLKTVLPVFLVTGGIASLAMGLFSGAICSLSGVPAARPSVAALAPAVLFVSAESMYRADFQGRSMLFPGALAQTCEAAAKLTVGTVCAYLLYLRGYSSAVVAAGAALGVTAGIAVAAGVLRLKLFSEGRLKNRSGVPGMGKQIVKESFPITLASGVMSIIGAADAAVILNRIASLGNTAGEAASLYGIYTGYAVTVYALPCALTGAVSSWVAPLVAGAFATKNGEKLSKGILTALKLSVGIGFFAASCYVLMPRELLGVFFSRSESELASSLLMLLAPSVVIAPMLSVFSSALYGMGKTKPAVIGGVVSGVLKLVLNCFLVGIPEIGIAGAPISAGVSFLVGMLVSSGGVGAVLRSMNVRPRFLRGLLFPSVCGLSAGCVSFWLCKFLADILCERLSAVLGVLAGCALLGVICVFAFPKIKKDDVTDEK